MASTRRSRENHWRIFVLRLRRVDELQPVAARARALDLAGEDLDGVARRERGVERHEAAVDPGADAPVADVGVDRVGEVDRRGAGGERDDLALGREDEDLVVLEVDLQRLHELAGVGGLLLPVDHALQPEQVLGRLALLVAPVRGDAVLGAPVHLLGADLHLDRLARRPDDRGVQRLVEVELGHRDVVLEPALHRLPHRVDRAQRGVAVLHRLDDDADADEVLDVVELLALGDHLLVDRPVVLRPALSPRPRCAARRAGRAARRAPCRGTRSRSGACVATICSISA